MDTSEVHSNATYIQPQFPSAFLYAFSMCMCELVFSFLVSCLCHLVAGFIFIVISDNEPICQIQTLYQFFICFIFHVFMHSCTQGIEFQLTFRVSIYSTVMLRTKILFGRNQGYWKTDTTFIPSFIERQIRRKKQRFVEVKFYSQFPANTNTNNRTK